MSVSEDSHDNNTDDRSGSSATRGTPSHSTTTSSSSSVRDAFVSRQLKVPSWNQKGLEETHALVLGAGGIGCGVALALCRLGVGRLTIVDMDVVDASNLNRQLLFSDDSIGKPKAAEAAKALRSHHAVITQVEHLHLDAVAEWGQVVAVATTSTVIFNGIDYGMWFDTAVGSLCLSLGIPYVAGSSYAHSYIVDYFPPRGLPASKSSSTATKASSVDGLPCVQCAGTVPSAEPGNLDRLHLLHYSKIQTHATLKDIITQDVGAPSTAAVGSYVLVCSMGSMAMVNQWLQGSVLSQPSAGEDATGGGGSDDATAVGEVRKIHTWTKGDLADPSAIVQFSVDRDPACPICCD